jgi:hypothetical protein
MVQEVRHYPVYISKAGSQPKSLSTVKMQDRKASRMIENVWTSCNRSSAKRRLQPEPIRDEATCVGGLCPINTQQPDSREKKGR